MLDMRRSEEAEGERRMMGSRRRLGFLGREGTSEALGVMEEGMLLDEEEVVPFVLVLEEWALVPLVGLGRLRLMKGSVNLWMCEKSLSWGCQLELCFNSSLDSLHKSIPSV